MKKYLLSALMLGCTVGMFSAAAAPVPEPRVQAKELYYNDPDVPQPLDKWTIFQLVFLPNVPNSTWNSNVFGLKTGWVASGGIGSVYGLEVSWVYSGTDTINGAQASWVIVKSKDLNGALTEGAGAGVNAGGLVLVGMPLQVASELAQSHKLLLREEALVRQHRVERGAAMTLAQDETVTIRHLRIGRVNGHHVIIQRDQLVDAGQGAARMTGLRLVQLFDNINSELSRFLLKRHSLFLHSGL